MRLHQEISVFEGQGPVPVKLTLDEIISAGRATNHYQIFVLAWLSEFFKNGLKAASLHLENPVTIGSNATSTEVINSLKQLSPENQVQLAQYLKDCIDVGESLLHSKEMNIQDWTRYVLQAQK